MSNPIKQLSLPEKGDNFFTICRCCGKLSYTNKSSAQFCQRNNLKESSTCNASFHNNGQEEYYDPVAITCFGEEVNIDQEIRRFYTYYEAPGQWSDPIAERLLFLRWHYYGPLPTGTEIFFVGSFVLRKIKMPKTGRVGYQFKPCNELTKQERDVTKSRIVKAGVDVFYDTLEEHPLSDDWVMTDFDGFYTELMDDCDRVNERDAYQKDRMAWS